MKSILRSGHVRKPSETLRLVLTYFLGLVFGFFLGVSFSTLPWTTKLKKNFEAPLLPPIDLTYIEDKYSGLSTQALLNVWSTLKGRRVGLPEDPSLNKTKVWVPTNPPGAERLPPGIVVSDTDFYEHKLWGLPEEFSDNFTIVLFHYDGRTSEWDEFEWSKRAIHVSAHKQTKWWYAKRFLHPNVVGAYDYIFIWDEDLGVEHFDAEEYLKLVKKHGVEISQPGLKPNIGLTWQMTKRRGDGEVHKATEEKPGWCPDPQLPPCAGFIEIMAPVFSNKAWRCVWHMIQPAHEKIGVIDSQWIVHQTIPSLGNQGEAQDGKAPWEGVRERCRREWSMFQDRIADAEQAYFESLGFTVSNTARYPTQL